MRKIIIAAILATFALTQAQAEDSPPVVLINPFTVPADALDETIAMWEQARDFLKTQPGYISTSLHQSLDPDARYQLINVAEWKNADDFLRAVTLMREQTNLPQIEGVTGDPTLYRVIRH